MGKWEDEYRDETFQWSDLLKIFDKDEDYVSAKDVNAQLKELGKIPKEDKTIKDYYDTLGLINKFENQVPPDILGAPTDFWGKDRAQLRDQMDELFPDRGKGTDFDQFTKAYAEKDLDKREKILGGKIYKDGQWIDRGKGLRTKFNVYQHGPHTERGRPFEETDVTEAILKGALKRPEDPYEGPFGKLGEYFSKNAAARDKLFQYIGSMGKELVKPIEPGEEAAGALVPTLSRGMARGEADYAAKQAAKAKYAMDLATAQQKINPLQYYTTSMKEAMAQIPEGIDPNSLEGRKWIATHLRQKGIPKAAVDIGNAIESFNVKMTQTSDEEERKRIQALIDEQYRLLEDMLSGSIGSSSVTNTISYLGG